MKNCLMRFLLNESSTAYQNDQTLNLPFDEAVLYFHFLSNIKNSNYAIILADLFTVSGLGCTTGGR